MHYTDINEIEPLTIISVKSKIDRNKQYYAFNLSHTEIPATDTMLMSIDENGWHEGILKINYYIESKHWIVGKGTSIKDACKDLVEKLNEQ